MTPTTATRYRPINLSAWEVRAIIEGRKTQTRRMVNYLPRLGKVTCIGGSETTGYDFCLRDKRDMWNEFREDELLKLCPFGQPGDHLWGREKFARSRNNWLYAADCVVDGGPQGNTDDWDWDSSMPNRWRPSTQMPRWASRIDLLIKSIRIERLQEISGPDCWAEGIESAGWDCTKWGSVTHCYRDLWEQANGPESWDANQFVWVIEHERVK